MKSQTVKRLIYLVIPIVFFLAILITFHFWPHATIFLGIDYTERAEMVIAYFLLTTLWFSGAWVVSRLANIFLFDALLKDRLGLEVPVLIKNLIRLFIYFVAFLGIVGVVYNKPITGLLTATGAVGVVLGFALKNMISDVFDGVSISIDKPFKVGDFIHFNDKGLRLQATVLETTWRTTRFRCDTAGVLVVPNSQLYKMAFTNLTTSGKTYFDLFFKFEVDIPINKAKKMLLSAAISTPGVMAEPAPEVVVKTIDSGTILFRLLFAFPPAKHKQRMMKDAVTCQVIDLCRLAGYQFGLEKEHLLIRRPKAEEVAHQRQSREHFLRKVPLFSELSHNEFKILLDGMDTLTLKAGTTAVEVDSTLSSLFIVNEGLLSVHIKGEKDRLIKVAYLNAGSFFGEMSLLTGSKATATIISENETQLFQIDKDTMKKLFDKNPELINAMSMTIATRQTENARRKEEILSGEALKSETKSIADKLVSSICNFFNIKS